MPSNGRAGRNAKVAAHEKRVRGPSGRFEQSIRPLHLADAIVSQEAVEQEMRTMCYKVTRSPGIDAVFRRMVAKAVMEWSRRAQTLRLERCKWTVLNLRAVVEDIPEELFKLCGCEATRDSILRYKRAPSDKQYRQLANTIAIMCAQLEEYRAWSLGQGASPAKGIRPSHGKRKRETQGDEGHDGAAAAANSKTRRSSAAANVTARKPTERPRAILRPRVGVSADKQDGRAHVAREARSGQDRRAEGIDSSEVDDTDLDRIIRGALDTRVAAGSSTSYYVECSDDDMPLSSQYFASGSSASSQ